MSFYTECIKTLCSKIGIDVIDRKDDVERSLYGRLAVIHKAQFLNHDLRCIIDFSVCSAELIDRFNAPNGTRSWLHDIYFTWTEFIDCSYNNDDFMMLQCILSTRSFRLVDDDRLLIGNPFYKMFTLLDCKNEEEFNVCVDMLAIDKKDENIKTAMRLFKTSSIMI